MPWAAIDCDAIYLSIVWKLVISFGYMFDKGGAHREEIDIACAVLGIYIAFKRSFFGFKFNKKMHYARSI